MICYNTRSKLSQWVFIMDFVDNLLILSVKCLYKHVFLRSGRALLLRSIPIQNHRNKVFKNVNLLTFEGDHQNDWVFHSRIVASLDQALLRLLRFCVNRRSSSREIPLAAEHYTRDAPDL